MVLNSKQISLFSTYSISVGPCILLHTNGKIPDYSRLHLRWRSDSYKNYPRDVVMLAFEHVAVIHRAVVALEQS